MPLPNTVTSVLKKIRPKHLATLDKQKIQLYGFHTTLYRIFPWALTYAECMMESAYGQSIWLVYKIKLNKLKPNKDKQLDQNDHLSYVFGQHMLTDTVAVSALLDKSGEPRGMILAKLFKQQFDWFNDQINMKAFEVILHDNDIYLIPNTVFFEIDFTKSFSSLKKLSSDMFDCLIYDSNEFQETKQKVDEALLLYYNSISAYHLIINVKMTPDQPSFTSNLTQTLHSQTHYYPWEVSTTEPVIYIDLTHSPLKSRLLIYPDDYHQLIFKYSKDVKKITKDKILSINLSNKENLKLLHQALEIRERQFIADLKKAGVCTPHLISLENEAQRIYLSCNLYLNEVVKKIWPKQLADTNNESEVIISSLPCVSEKHHQILEFLTEIQQMAEKSSEIYSELLDIRKTLIGFDLQDILKNSSLVKQDSEQLTGSAFTGEMPKKIVNRSKEIFEQINLFSSRIDELKSSVWNLTQEISKENTQRKAKNLSIAWNNATYKTLEQMHQWEQTAYCNTFNIFKLK